MIQFFEHRQIDKQRWDDAIDRSANGLVYAKSWYLDVVSPGWCALANSDFTSVFPLNTGYKYGMHYLFPPFFTQQLGLFSAQEITEGDMAAFIQAIPHRYRYIEMQINTANPVPSEFEITPRRNHVLDIYRPLDKIRAGYSENHARSLKRAVREGVSVNTQGNIRDVIRLFRQGKGREVAALKEKHYDMFTRLAEKAMQMSSCDVRTATNSAGQIVAGAVFFRYRDRSILIFSGASEQARLVSAAHLIVDDYISQWAGRIAVLDFEGSDNPNLARFYKGFGSLESTYVKLKRNNLPFPWRLFK